MTRLAGALVLAALATGGCGTGAVVAAPEVAAPEVAPSKTEASPAEPTRTDPAPDRSKDEPAPPGPASRLTSAEAPKEVGARHVLVQYVGSERADAHVVRSRDQAEALAQKVLDRARRGESFTRLAAEYSDEPGAAARGGALGKFGRGKMAPKFEEAAFRLRVGEISDVVETPFGFHVILRTE